jgi:hypothetical protein
VTFPQRIERLLEEHRLEAAQFDDREILGLWTRALTSYGDAGVAGLSEEGAFTRAYDAGRQAATTLLAAVRLRVRGQAHHYTVFYALAALEDGARAAIAAGFERWEAHLREGLTRMKTRGKLRADADPAALATATMASLQGGLLLTQVRRDPRQLRIALNAARANLRLAAA